MEGMRGSIFLLIVAVGFPMFILLNIFKWGSFPVPEIRDPAEVKKQLSQLDEAVYRIHSIQNDGGVLRVNIVLNALSPSAEEVQMRTFNVLYDVQALLGRDRTVSVCVGTSEGTEIFKAHGLAFYSANTESYYFKDGSDIY